MGLGCFTQENIYGGIHETSPMSLASMSGRLETGMKENLCTC